MTTTTRTVQVPVFHTTRHHSITLDQYGRHGLKEEVFGYFGTNWRNTPAIVTMYADRYTYADGRLSDWRMYAREAREYVSDATDDYKRENGPSLTDLARSRLGDSCKPQMEEWLTGNVALPSGTYRQSEQRAYYRAIRNLVRDLSPYGDPPSHYVRETVDRYRDKLSPWLFDGTRPNRLTDSLTAMCDAYDLYAAALRDMDE